jgi:hypothetical protein
MRTLSLLRHKTAAVVIDLQHDMVFMIGKREGNLCRLGVFRHVAQRFLGDTEQAFRKLQIQRSARFRQSKMDGYAFTLFELLCGDLQRACNA